jgi:hypothetical protein
MDSAVLNARHIDLIGDQRLAAATHVRSAIQAEHRPRIGQLERQLQLCVPPEQTSGDSIRLAQALAGTGVQTLDGRR